MTGNAICTFESPPRRQGAIWGSAAWQGYPGRPDPEPIADLPVVTGESFHLGLGLAEDFAGCVLRGLSCALVAGEACATPYRRGRSTNPCSAPSPRSPI